MGSTANQSLFTRGTEQLKVNSEIEFNDVMKDLKNGVVLVQLAKILTCKETPRRWAFKPKRNVDMVQNCDLALEMFTKDGVHFIGISGRKNLSICSPK